MESEAHDPKSIFSKNLRYFLNLNKKKQKDLAKYTGASTGLVSSWCRGEKMPRVNTINEICDWFHIEMSDLLTDKTKQQEEGYYITEEINRIAAEVYNNPDLRALLDICIEMNSQKLKNLLEFVKLSV